MQFWICHILSFKMIYDAACYLSGMGTCHLWWPLLQQYKCVLCICLFIVLALICVPFLFLVMSGLAAACNCGTPWTYLCLLYFFLINILTWKRNASPKRWYNLLHALYIMQVRKCSLSWFLVAFHIMAYWKFGSVFIFFKTWVGQSFTRMQRVRVAQAYVWYLPISEGTPYILPIFLENLPTKIWEFPSLSYISPYLEFRSPYQNLRISFFV